MPQKTTLKELSKLLNLSISTVSKALNDNPEISELTKKRVRDLALLNNYIPNVAARNLKTQQTKTIGVIIPSIQSSFFTGVLEGIEAKADAMHYKIYLCISNESLKKERECIKKFVQTQVDGIIISPSRETQATGDFDHLTQLKAYEIPLVIFDRLVDIIDCDKISIDDTFHAEMAVTEMHNTGCKRLAFLSNLSDTSIHNNRKLGYSLAVNRLGLPVTAIEYREQFPFEKISRLINTRKLDGILACTEHSAIEAMQYILNEGYRIPKDVAIIGFDNGNLSKNFIPSLSAIDQKANEQGQLALETMADRIAGNLPAEKMAYLLRAEIIHRQSTKNRKQKFAYS